ncbi:MAG: capsule assembly Wzi family protein [Candidatus Zixiibacteriota bacterium]
MKKRIIILIKGVLFVFLATSNFSQASLLENIPLNSWVYPTVDELYVQGFFPELHKNVKPYQRWEIASFLIQIDEKIKNKELIPTEAQGWLLAKLGDEFSLEMKTLREEKGEKVVKCGLYPYLYLTQNRIDTSWSRGKLELDFAFQFKNRLLLKDKILLDTKAEKDPNIYGREWKKDLTGIFDQGYMKIDFKYFNLLFGRDYLRWGPGQNDFLLVSGLAPPFDMLKLGGEIGKFKFLFFATILDEKTISDTLYKRYLSGHRINFKPKPYLE